MIKNQRQQILDINLEASQVNIKRQILESIIYTTPLPLNIFVYIQEFTPRITKEKYEPVNISQVI
jgi:hypothetical protein